MPSQNQDGQQANKPTGQGEEFDMAKWHANQKSKRGRCWRAKEYSGHCQGLAFHILLIRFGFNYGFLYIWIKCWYYSLRSLANCWYSFGSGHHFLFSFDRGHHLALTSCGLGHLLVFIMLGLALFFLLFCFGTPF